MKSTPQFAPFDGELPPLNAATPDTNAPQLKPGGSAINREFDDPELPATRLKPVRLLRINDTEGESGRSKREAHHTPEHTAQQQQQQQQQQQPDAYDTRILQSGCFSLKAPESWLLMSLILIRL